MPNTYSAASLADRLLKRATSGAPGGTTPPTPTPTPTPNGTTAPPQGNGQQPPVKPVTPPKPKEEKWGPGNAHVWLPALQDKLNSFDQRFSKMEGLANGFQDWGKAGFLEKIMTILRGLFSGDWGVRKEASADSAEFDRVLVALLGHKGFRKLASAYSAMGVIPPDNDVILRGITSDGISRESVHGMAKCAGLCATILRSSPSEAAALDRDIAALKLASFGVEALWLAKQAAGPGARPIPPRRAVNRSNAPSAPKRKKKRAPTRSSGGNIFGYGAAAGSAALATKLYDNANALVVSDKDGNWTEKGTGNQVFVRDPNASKKQTKVKLDRTGHPIVEYGQSALDTLDRIEAAVAGVDPLALAGYKTPARKQPSAFGSGNNSNALASVLSNPRLAALVKQDPDLLPVLLRNAGSGSAWQNISSGAADIEY